MVRKIAKKKGLIPKSRRRKLSADPPESYHAVRTPKRKRSLGQQSDGDEEDAPSRQIIDQLQEVAKTYKQKYEMVRNQYDVLKTQHNVYLMHQSAKLTHNEVCQVLSKRISRLIGLVSEEQSLSQSEAIGEALIEMKIVTEQVGELINSQG